MTLDAGAGIVRRKSNHSIDHIVRKLEELLREKGIKLFALVYNRPEYLRERHGLSTELVQNMAVIEKLAGAVSE